MNMVAERSVTIPDNLLQIVTLHFVGPARKRNNSSRKAPSYQIDTAFPAVDEATIASRTAMPFTACSGGTM